MKDALGHGSAAHQSGVDKIAGSEHLVPIDSIRPRPENTAMIEKLRAHENFVEAAAREAYPNEPYTRHGPDEVIAAYRERIRAGDQSLPPLAVTRKGFIQDGEHRWRAYKAEGRTHVPVRVLK